MKDVIRIPLRHVSTGRSVQSEWQAAGLILFTAALCVVVLFWSTIQSMIDVWGSSRTFAHGFLVLPAAGYLIWSYRPKLVGLVPAPERLGTPGDFSIRGRMGYGTGEPVTVAATGCHC